MVKADYKRDYYADLELPNTADQETIKKKFRELAKQYHPDRNPGREVDVVPKFQAIQAAHEILGDPNQKAKYDSERAKLNKPTRENDSPAPTFKKPGPPRRTDSGYPNGNFQQPGSQPPPRRDASATRYAPQSGPRRPNSATPSGNDKFAQFARAAPQQRWDHAKFEEAARAEAFRGMNAMRGGGIPQTSPLRSRPHPTAPRSAGNGADPYSAGAEPSPGFPGLGRTGSGRRYQPSDDSQSRSAYAQYHRPERERPPSAGPYPGPDAHHGARESNSPLRTTRSFQPEDFQNVRPGLSRTSSRPYARTGGERTTLGADTNIGRSTSVRNSPIDKRWDEESGPFGTQATPEERRPRPRHRSHSPARPGGPHFQFTSESSSDGDESPLPQDRPRANMRRPHTQFSGNEPSRPMDDGMSGYFPKTNYNSRVVDEHTYHFPAPEMKGGPSRKATSNLGSPNEHHESHPRSASQEDVSGSTNTHTQSPSKGQSKFSPEEWHDVLGENADMFTPPDAKDRKSPTKSSRTARPAQRSYATTKEARRDAINGDLDPSIAAGMKYINPEEARDKAAAFHPGRLSNDFVDKANEPRHATGATPTETRPESVRTQSGQTNGHDRTPPDEMDLDSPAPQDSESTVSTDANFNVTVEEEYSPAPPNAPRERMSRQHSASNGLDLNDLARSAPFAPSDTGLKDLKDLGDNLPFQSRPSETLQALHRTTSSTLRELDLPRPPKPPHCLTESELDQHSWKRYGDAMTTYMHDWNKFNHAMIEHFQAQQEAVTHGMYRNWVCAQGDGASADDFAASGGTNRAGYATYMTWLEDNRKSRMWWDVAFEEHRICMEGLGKVRKRVKELNSGTKVT